MRFTHDFLTSVWAVFSYCAKTWEWPALMQVVYVSSCHFGRQLRRGKAASLELAILRSTAHYY